MNCVAGIYILSEKKARILTAVKASLRQLEAEMPLDAIEKVGEQIKSQWFSQALDEISSSFGACLAHNTAVILFEDYISLVYENADLDTLQAQAIQYSEFFSVPVLFCAMPDSDTIIFGVATDGKLRTELVFGEYLEELELEGKKINLDYLSYLFNDKKLTDLNSLESVSEIIYSLEEDYGIYAELSPLSIPLYEGKFKTLEENPTFNVYSTL